MTDGIVVGLDVGTSFIRVAIGEYDVETGKIQIVGTSKKKSAGLRNGAIVNIEEAKKAVKEAIEAAELNAGIVVESVITAIGGAQIESMNCDGSVPVSSSGKGNKEITQADIQRVLESATAIPIPADREKLHTISQHYIVDGVGGIQNPINRIGVRLGVEVHIVTASKGIITNLGNCLNRAGYLLDGVMLKTLAATKAVCPDEDELELGSILIDLGAGTTDIIVFVNGGPIATASVPVGGNLVTNDIAVVTGIPVAVAEERKIESGCCWLPLITEETDTEVILPGVGGRDPEIIYRSQLCQIIQARMDQIFTMAKSAIVKATKNYVTELSGNIVLTGGGALMEGVDELAKSVFKTSSVRIGKPGNLGGITEDYQSPDFATAVGLVVSNTKYAENKTNHKKFIGHIAKKEKNTENDKLKNFFKLFF